MTDHRGLVIGSGTSRALVFLPGFLAPASGYRDLVTPLAGDDPGLGVHIPQLYRRGLSALAGGRPVREEAQAAAEVAARLAAAGHAVWLGGHSRGGQAAWLAAEALSRSRVPVAGLMLVDPVDGSGPGSGPTTTTGPAGFAFAPLIVGAGLGGRCAPAAMGHPAFAASAAAAATEPIHVVVTTLGHADVLGGWARTVGRRLCGGGSDPDAGRATVTALMAAHMRGALAEHRGALAEREGAWPSPVQWR